MIVLVGLLFVVGVVGVGVGVGFVVFGGGGGGVVSAWWVSPAQFGRTKGYTNSVSTCSIDCLPCRSPAPGVFAHMHHFFFVWRVKGLNPCHESARRLEFASCFFFLVFLKEHSMHIPPFATPRQDEHRHQLTPPARPSPQRPDRSNRTDLASRYSSRQQPAVLRRTSPNLDP